MADENSTLKILYSEAIYAVFSDGEEIRFKVGENSPKINLLLDRYHAATFAFLTAYNPFSKVLSATENKTRQNELSEILQSEKFRFLKGYGTNEEESWEREESLFILNIPEPNVLKIARRFEQYAMLFGEKNKQIKLLWC